MKKILLVDDRAERQHRFTKDTGIKLEDYNDILDNISGNDYYKNVEKWSKEILDLKHDVIIIHRSAFGESEVNILDKFKEYCKKTEKKLVFFSGGISSTFYLNSPFEFLLVNSKVLYSNNLKIFLDDCRKGNMDLLKIGYGEKWKLTLLLNSLEKINLYLGYNESEDMVYYEEFIEETNLLLIKKFIKYEKPKLKNGGVKISDLKKLSADITNQIKEQVVLNV